jgi:hypothetical protein
VVEDHRLIAEGFSFFLPFNTSEPLSLPQEFSFCFLSKRKLERAGLEPIVASLLLKGAEVRTQFLGRKQLKGGFKELNKLLERVGFEPTKPEGA